MSILASIFRPLAYISLPYILLRSLSQTSPIAQYYIRLTVYLSALATVGACSSFIAATMAMVGEKYNVNWVVARLFYNVAGRLMEIDVLVEGEEWLSARPAVLMSNHQSILDILVVGRLYPKQSSIMAKKSIQYTPIGPFMTFSGAVFIDRRNAASAKRSLDAAGETMKLHNTSLWMYPEGTRHNSEKPDMLPLKKGGFHLAVQSGLPIVPVVTENYWRIFHNGVFGKGTIRVRVLPPIDTTGLTVDNIPQLADDIRGKMLEQLRDMAGVSAPPTASNDKDKEDKDSHSRSLTSQPAPRSPTTITTAKHIPPPIISTPASFTFGSNVPPRGLDSAGSEGSSSFLMSDSFARPLVDDPIASSVQQIQHQMRPSEEEGSVEGSSSSASVGGAETEEDEGMVLVGRPTSDV